MSGDLGIMLEMKLRGGGSGLGVRRYVLVFKSKVSIGGTPKGSKNMSEQNSTGLIFKNVALIFKWEF